MSDIITAITIKNMAREAVRKMTATARNGRYGAAVAYFDGTNFMSRKFDSVEAAEAWAKSKGWKKGDPWHTKRTGEYSIHEY